MHKISKLNEDIGKTGNDSIGFGVKGKFKVHKNNGKNGVVNPYTKIVEEDKRVLAELMEKINTYVQGMTEMYQFLDQYGKLNADPIQTVINSLKSYMESISKELGDIK